MTRKIVWIVIGGMLFNAVTGFVILRNSMYDKYSFVFSCIAYLLWLVICVALTYDKKFSLKKACKMGFAFAFCYVCEVIMFVAVLRHERKGHYQK